MPFIQSGTTKDGLNVKINLPKYFELIKKSGRLTVVVSILFTLFSILEMKYIPDLRTHY